MAYFMANTLEIPHQREAGGVAFTLSSTHSPFVRFPGVKDE